MSTSSRLALATLLGLALATSSAAAEVWIVPSRPVGSPYAPGTPQNPYQVWSDRGWQGTLQPYGRPAAPQGYFLAPSLPAVPGGFGSAWDGVYAPGFHGADEAP